MLLTLDVGNSQIYGGVFDDEKLKLQFRRTSRYSPSSDELGVFFKNVLRENDISPGALKAISICSVVPDVIHSLRGACQKYFKISPFILEPGTKTGLKIKYRNPVEVGSDRIADAIGAIQMFPNKNVIVIDFGTATTFSVVTAEKEYLGGLILPGLRLSMEALEANTAKLPSVEIIAPPEIIGRSTVESIQSGLYYGNLCLVREMVREIKRGYLQSGAETVVIGTGGFSRLFEKEKVFDALVPELILIGLNRAFRMNH